MVFEEYRKSEENRKRKEIVHTALLNIYEKIRSVSTTCKPPYFQSSSSKFKGSPSVASSKLKSSNTTSSGQLPGD